MNTQQERMPSMENAVMAQDLKADNESADVADSPFKTKLLQEYHSGTKCLSTSGWVRWTCPF